MSLELNYLSLNLIAISLSVIIFEGLIAGNERAKVMNNLNCKKNQVNKSNVLNANENEACSSNAPKVSNYKSHQNETNIDANLKMDKNTELLIEQSSKKDEQRLKTTDSLEETIIEKQHETTLSTVKATKLNCKKLSEQEPNLENVEQGKEFITSFSRIPTIYILAYIFFIFIMLFLTFYYRPIIKLYNLIYASLIVFVTFIYLDLFTSKLFKRNSILNKSRIISLTSFNTSKFDKLSFCDFFIDFLRFLIALAIAFGLASFWYLNRSNHCIWLFHNLIGCLICVSTVCTLRLINLRQIFITLTVFTCLDVFFAHFSKYIYNGSITRSFVKRDLNIEELDLNLQLNGSKMSSGLTNEHYRVPSIFLVPKISLIDAVMLNFSCTHLTHFAIIGFGDLIVGGMIAEYCNYFDKLKRTKCIYFITSITSNLVALILMVLLNDSLKLKGMPALLFLCPINFLSLFTLAFYRQEFREFWSLEPFSENYSNVNLKKEDV